MSRWFVHLLFCWLSFIYIFIHYIYIWLWVIAMHWHCRMFCMKRFSWFLVILIWCQHFTILHFKERYEIFRWDGISKKNYFFCVMMVMVSTWCHFKSTNSVFATPFFVSIDSSFLKFKRIRSVFCRCERIVFRDWIHLDFSLNVLKLWRNKMFQTPATYHLPNIRLRQ